MSPTDEPVRGARAQADDPQSATPVMDRGTLGSVSAGARPLDLAHAMELADEGYLHVDAEGYVDLATDTARRLLGDPGRRLLGLTVLETFVDRRAEVTVEAARSGIAGSFEHTLRHPEPRTIAVRALPDGSAGSWLLLADVTELRRLQQIRSQFIGNLSHELRTPLTTVSLLAETLAREADQAEGELTERMRDRIARIEVEAGHLVQMVNELLDLARIESGGPIELHDDVDLTQLAVASAERLRLFAERQGVRLAVETEPGVPHVRGDAARLGQVLVNLLHNAVKFSPDGGDVVLGVGRSDGEVRVVVEDHGIGIPPADRERVFERFYKVDRARTRVAGGTGLGLAIARHVVAAHGGRITLVSEVGKGSAFTVWLPSSPAPAPTRAANPTVDRASAAASGRSARG